MPYENVETGQIETIPHCLWYPYRNALLRKIAEKYGCVCRTRGSPSSRKAA
jgi:hypothetical protein